MATSFQALETRFNSFINRETPWAFFTGLGDYVRYALATPVFKKIIKEQFDIFKTHTDGIEKAELRTLEEMRQAEDVLLKIIEDKKIDPKSFEKGFSHIPSVPGHEENLLEQLKKFESGEIQVGGYHSDYLNLFLFDIAANLLRLGYGDDLKQFMVSDKEYGDYYMRINGAQNGVAFGGNTRGNFLFSKTWSDRFERDRVLNVARQAEPWGAFEILIKFHLAQVEAAKDAGSWWVIQDCTTDPDFPMSSNGTIDVYFAMTDLKKVFKNHATSDSSLKFLHVGELRPIISRAHFFLMQAAIEDDPATKMKRRAMTEALRIKKEEAWKGSVDAFMRRVEEFMEDYTRDKQALEKSKQTEKGGRWWKLGSKPVYDKENRKILLENKECEIPKTAYNKLILCEYLFPPKRPFGDALNEYEVIDLFYKRGKKISPRAFYDTVSDVNDLIEEKLKVVDMLKYQADPCQVRVRKDLFP